MSSDDTSDQDMFLVIHRRHGKRFRAAPEANTDHKFCQQCQHTVPLKDMMEWGRQNICRKCSQSNFWQKLSNAHRWYYNERRNAHCFKCGFAGATEPRCINNVLPEGLHRRPEKRLLRLAKQNNLTELKREIHSGVWVCVCCSRETRFQQFLDTKVPMNEWPKWKSSAVPRWFNQKLYCEQSIMLRELQMKIGQCKDCNKRVSADNWMCFDWDHINPAHKSFTIGIKIGCIPTTTLLTEVDKCELRCVNCHCIRTQKEHHGEIRRLGSQTNLHFFNKCQSTSDENENIGTI